MKTHRTSKPATTPRTHSMWSIPRGQKLTPMLVVLIFIFIASGTSAMVLVYDVFQPQVRAFLHKSPITLVAEATSSSAYSTHAVTSTQTPTCTGSILQIGTASWRIESIQRDADGSINVPTENPDVAYWISDLENNSVFALNPTPENSAKLKAVQGGEEALVTWDNCNSTTFTLFEFAIGSPSNRILSDHARLGIIVYIPESPSSSGMLVQGVLAGETITSTIISTPLP